jgi:two-component system LytT family response regulator
MNAMSEVLAADTATIFHRLSAEDYDRKEGSGPNSMKALVVDDEELAREEMRRLLGESRRFSEIVAAGTGEEALGLCKDHPPDAVFVDIQMPGLDGFEFIARMDHPVPIVITTAYSEYAVRAFESGVVDYLVKPIDPERLRLALDRISATISGQPEAETKFSLANEDRVFVRDAGRFWLLTIGDIEVLESCGNYTKIFFPGGPATIRKTLREFSERLDPHVFFRINRDHIVNVRKIVRVTPAHRGQLMIEMGPDAVFEMSRQQSAEFQRLMGL